MKLEQTFNYEKFNLTFHDGERLFEIKDKKKLYGVLILKEVLDTQIVSFNLTESMTYIEYIDLFENILQLVKKFTAKVLLYYALRENPFTDFLIERGGYTISRIEMSLELDRYTPPPLSLPEDVEISPFLMGPIKKKIEVCFDTIPEFDRFIFSSFSPQDLEKLYTFLYTGREGPFLPEFSLNLYYMKELAGFIMVNLFPKERFTISEILILSPYQGRGFGKLLLSESLNKMKKKDLKTVILSVTEKNIKAYNMYKKFGFQDKRRYTVYVYPL